MPITAHRIPYGDKAICADATNACEHIVREFNKCFDFKGAAENTETEFNLREETMRNVASRITGRNYRPLECDLDRDTIVWLMNLELFWRKPAHVQLLETQLGVIKASLKKRTEFLAWLTTHVQSPKFQGDGNAWICTTDLIHAMRQHGVYGG